MGLFADKFSGLTRNTTLGPAEAFAAIALSAVAADGYISNEEIMSLITILSRMQLFRSYSNDVMRRMFDKLLSLFQRQGMEALINLAVTSLPHELNETAFAVTTDIVLADGEVTAEEEQLLNYLYRILNISEATASKIIDVMLIKNRG